MFWFRNHFKDCIILFFMILNIILFIIGFIFLIKGSDVFVRSASKIAKSLGVSEFIIGLTLVAVGTSLPELAASIVASIEGQGEIILGQVIGSNIANIGLIVGVASLFATLKVNKQVLDRDAYFMLLAKFLGILFITNLIISSVEGGILLAFYLSYILFLIQSKEDSKASFKEFFRFLVSFKFFKRIKKSDKKMDWSLAKQSGILILSGIFIFVGAKFLVEQAVFFGDLFNVSKTIIGLSVLAFGTSLPELGVAIAAARKGMGEMIIGNIIGSNIANIFLVLGFSSIIKPISISKMTLYYTAPFMLGMGLLFVYFMKTKKGVSKKEGILLLLLYVLFIISLIMF